MTDAEDQAAITLGFIEGTNSLADAMDAMKQALESRGWSTPVSEQVGAALGAHLIGMIGNPPPPPRKGKP